MTEEADLPDTIGYLRTMNELLLQALAELYFDGDKTRAEGVLHYYGVI